MDSAQEKIRELWARQGILPADLDYGSWERKRAEIAKMATLSRSCVFAVDVYKERYDYISEGFVDLFGVLPETVEELLHPDDRASVADLQIRHSKFIYSLPAEERNDYRTIYQVRMRCVEAGSGALADSGAEGRWINVTSRNQVIETDRRGKAWIVMGLIELAPDQTPTDRVRCSVLNLRTGRFFNPYAESLEWALTERESEILSLMARGLLSKEIAERLGISKLTVDNHRKNILAKLEADNAIEAINAARRAGLVE
ncbi:MAG: LuxR C-terminal-related transcriptional regulator [Alistipes sp.]|jgi:DNA-binding CsgD family transcriptional regulator|nr:LuxR C-terminal-related transcriptional regulator [Alistipes sp.]